MKSQRKERYSRPRKLHDKKRIRKKAIGHRIPSQQAFKEPDLTGKSCASVVQPRLQYK